MASMNNQANVPEATCRHEPERRSHPPGAATLKVSVAPDGAAA